MPQNNFQQYIDQLFTLIGMDNLPADFREVYEEKLGLEVKKRLGLMAMRELTPVQLTEFMAKFEDNTSNQADLLAYLEQNIPDYQNKVQEVLRDFAVEFKSSLDNLKTDIQTEV